MPLPGKAILAVWNEVDPDSEDDYNELVPREHIIEAHLRSRTVSRPPVSRRRRIAALHGVL